MSICRRNMLMPNEVPRYIRCYDNGGESFDRYTVVFTGNYRGRNGYVWNGRLVLGDFVHIGCSNDPYHPKGFGQHGDSKIQIDRPTSSHLGKRVKFQVLPAQVQKMVKSTYTALWDIGG